MEERLSYEQMKEARDREAAAKAERERREAENRGEIDAKGIVDRMDAWEGKSSPRDLVDEAIAAAGVGDEEGGEE